MMARGRVDLVVAAEEAGVVVGDLLVHRVDRGDDHQRDHGQDHPGGGRKRAADLDPGLLPALLALVEPDERGDPMSPLRWTTKSTRNLAGELTAQGRKVSADTVGDLLRAEGFSLQGNAKTLEASGTRTGTPSSATSTSRSRPTRTPPTR